MRHKDTIGAKPTKKLKTAQARLLLILWNLHGGATEVARLLGIRKQLPVNWKIRGQVPFKYVGPIARKLQLLPELLNYEETIAFRGKGKPFAVYVRRLKLPENDQKYIFRGEKPRSPEEILKDG